MMQPGEMTFLTVDRFAICCPGVQQQLWNKGSVRKYTHKYLLLNKDNNTDKMVKHHIKKETIQMLFITMGFY